MDANEEESSSAESSTSVIKETGVKENRDGTDVLATKEMTKTPEKDEHQIRSFPDLPMIVMEYILAHFSYFEVLQFRLISTFWDDLIRAYLDKADEVFTHNLAHHNVQWLAVKEVIEDFKQPSFEENFETACSSSSSYTSSKRPRNVPKMSPRYHHCACYLNESMYVFGGCIAPSTAYNDLWRFDMPSKRWHRIIASGSPPLPRLFCSFTPYKTVNEITGEKRQYIVLFGGFLFDEKLSLQERLLATVHLFDVAENRWTVINTGGSATPDEPILRSGNHSAVVIGEELIVFNGLRLVSDGSSETEVPCHQVYTFHLKEHRWSMQFGGNFRKSSSSTSSSVNSSSPLSFIRRTLESSQPPPSAKRKAAVQTPVALDAHNILYICGSNTNVLFIAAFLLTRKRCLQQGCKLCLEQKEEENVEKEQEKEPEKKSDKPDKFQWQWEQVEISKEGLDFEFTYGVEFCKVGNMMAYLTAKDVAVPVKRPPPPPPSPAPESSSSYTITRQPPSSHPPLPLYRSNVLMSQANKKLLRERRIEALDYYKRQFAQMLQDQRDNLHNLHNQVATIQRHSESPTIHRSTLQLRLLDISRVISERQIDRVKQRHEMDYSVVPEALSAYSLVAAPDALLLFGGYFVHFDQDFSRDGPPRGGVAGSGLAILQSPGGALTGPLVSVGNNEFAVSSKLFMISSKPEVRLY